MNTEQQLRLRLAGLLTDRLLRDIEPEPSRFGIVSAAARVAQKELQIVLDGGATGLEQNLRLRISSIYFEEAIGELRNLMSTYSLTGSMHDTLVAIARNAQAEIDAVIAGR